MYETRVQMFDHDMRTQKGDKRPGEVAPRKGWKKQ